MECSQTLWGTIGRALAASFMEWQRSASMAPGMPPPPAVLAIRASYDRVLAAMQVLGVTCPLIGTFFQVHACHVLGIDMRRHTGNEMNKLRQG